MRGWLTDSEIQPCTSDPAKSSSVEITGPFMVPILVTPTPEVGAIDTGIPIEGADFNFAEGVRTPTVVPEPTTMLLLGSGLVGIAAKVRKRRKTV